MSVYNIAVSEVTQWERSIARSLLGTDDFPWRMDDGSEGLCCARAPG